MSAAPGAAPAPLSPERRQALARKALSLSALEYREHLERLSERERAYSLAVRNGEVRP